MPPLSIASHQNERATTLLTPFYDDKLDEEVPNLGNQRVEMSKGEVRL